MINKNFEKISDEKKKQIITKGIEIFSKFSFVEARTDLIAHEAGISKGLLFYYFGSKKNFYLYLFDYTIDLLTQDSEYKEIHDNFYEIIFDMMDMKYNFITKYPDEIRFLNMVSKETHREVSKEVRDIFSVYHKKSKEKSSKIILNAVEKLRLRQDIDTQKIIESLSLYIDAIVMKYLRLYHDKPMELFDNFDEFKEDVKEYLDLMIYGIVIK
ncbi:TetR/AcrR family transcriptional regulator [Treponema denticola]|uniref:TetR/AcrR family transcriptional regulator n=1 Tax=Treponema denticola TaxID=158 RepID=UPI0001FD38B2|nr:TetR/AcrR family transcriptional regulator [Treponema denticola]EGC78297.1 transcription regulator [Treponema denticola F0402]UTC84685.1 TetR/AcrR family transcriptional regulator [Treponema denticola]